MEAATWGQTRCPVYRSGTFNEQHSTLNFQRGNRKGARWSGSGDRHDVWAVGGANRGTGTIFGSGGRIFDTSELTQRRVGRSNRAAAPRYGDRHDVCPHSMNCVPVPIARSPVSPPRSSDLFRPGKSGARTLSDRGDRNSVPVPGPRTPCLSPFHVDSQYRGVYVWPKYRRSRATKIGPRSGPIS